MLSTIVGNVDVPAAAVLIALFIGLGIAFAVWRTTRKTRKDYELSETHERNEHDRLMFDRETYRRVKLAEETTKREIQQKQVEAGLLISHKSDDNHNRSGGDGY